MSALLVDQPDDHLLEWTDLVLAIDTNGMNTNPTRLFGAAQVYWLFPWLVWQTARVLDMLKDSYLFNGEPRIINDPERWTVLHAGFRMGGLGILTR